MTHKLIGCIAILLLLSLSAAAVNYTVKANGGGNFTTIQACAKAMQSGDSCTVFAGDYTSEGVITINAGSVRANPGDNVYAAGWFTYSSVTIDGFHVQNISSPTTPCLTVAATKPVTTKVAITNNSFYACGGIGTASASDRFPTFVAIQNNSFIYMCSTKDAPDVCRPIIVRGDHWLIDGNDFSHSNTPVLLQAGSFNIIRRNTAHDIFSRDPDQHFATRDCIPSFGNPPSAKIDALGNVAWLSGDTFENEYPGVWVKIGGQKYTVASVNYTTNKAMTLNGSAPTGTQTLTGGNGGNCHSDFFGSEPGFPAQHNVVEGNTITNLPGNDSKVVIAQGDQCGGKCFGLIIRENLARHIGSTVILNDNAQKSVNPGFYAVKTYSNTWDDTDLYHPLFGVSDTYTHNSINAADINNLFHFPGSMQNFTPVSDDASTDSTFVSRNNLAWCAGSLCNLHSHIYGKGRFTDDPGNIIADPKFSNYLNGDLHPSLNSPVISAGSYLTKVAGKDSGNGSTLLVDDATFFQDGYGLPGVQADQIRIGTNRVAQIASINYAANVITLANAVTRSPGEPIYLFSDSTGKIVLFGNAPNIGAISSANQDIPAPPTGLQVQVN